MSQSGIAGFTSSNLPSNVPTSFVTNAGTAVPLANIIEILGSGGTTTSGVGNIITITVSGSGMTWNRISSSQTLAVNNGYFCVAPGGALSLLLPPVSVLGDEIEITIDGAASFTVTQGAGQTIKLGNQTTTPGIGGSISSTQQGDTIRMVCKVNNLEWNILSMMGNTIFV